jgi:hypothetical protein
MTWARKYFPGQKVGHSTLIRADNYRWIAECECGRQHTLVPHRVLRGELTGLCSECTGGSRKRKIVPEGMRWCSGCKQAKSIDQFFQDHTKRKHMAGKCRECVRRHNREQRRTFKGRYAHFVREAKRIGRQCDLTFDWWYAQVKEDQCCYCGGSLGVAGSGVDRKDPNVGYIESNCVPCCGVCNWIKNSILTYDEMLRVGEIIREIRTYRELTLRKPNRQCDD